MKKTLYYAGLALIAIWLFTIHAKYTSALVVHSADLFVFGAIDLQMYIPYVWGAAFAIVTTIIIALLPRDDKAYWYFVAILAAIEVTGVFGYNNAIININTINANYGAIYYGVYSGFIIIAYAYISGAEKLQQDAIEQVSDEELNAMINRAFKEDELQKNRNELQVQNNETTNIASAIAQEEKRKNDANDLQNSFDNAISGVKNGMKNHNKIDELIIEGYTNNQISKIIGCHATTVYRRRKKLDYDTNNKNNN